LASAARLKVESAFCQPPSVSYPSTPSFPVSPSPSPSVATNTIPLSQVSSSQIPQVVPSSAIISPPTSQLPTFFIAALTDTSATSLPPTPISPNDIESNVIGTSTTYVPIPTSLQVTSGPSVISNQYIHESYTYRYQY